MDRTLLMIVVMCCMLAALVCIEDDWRQVSHHSPNVISSARIAAKNLSGEYIDTFYPAFEKVVDSRYSYFVAFEANFYEDTRITRWKCTAEVDWITISYASLENSPCRRT